MHRLPLNQEYFSNIQDDNVLYWAGFLMADGCIHKNQIHLALAEKDLDHLKQFKSDLKTNLSLVKNISKCSKRNPEWKDSICYHLTISSSKMVEDLSIFGLTKQKTFTCEFPQIIKDLPNVNNYCRGYFDGDGSICVANRKMYSNYLMVNIRGTSNFLKSFNELLVDKAGLPSRCLDKTTHSPSKIGVITYSGTPICIKIANWLYKDMTSNSRFLERKYNIFNNFIQ